LRWQTAIGSEQEFEKFKTHALDFGTGKETAEEFYGYLHQQIGSPDLDSIIVDFARLLPLPALRIPLLKVHYTRLERERAQHPSLDSFRNKSYSSAGRPRDSSCTFARTLIEGIRLQDALTRMLALWCGV